MEASQLREFLNKVVQEMAQFTFPYILSVVGVVDEKEGEHIGSGLRCLWQGRRAFVTAYHVIQKANSDQYQGFAVSSERGSPPFQVTGKTEIIDNEGDIIICYLPDDYPEHETIQYWPENRIEANSVSLDTDYLFTHGFPGEKSRFFLQQMTNKSLPYGAMERLDKDLRLEDYQFALDHQIAFTSDQSGVQAWINPHGMSGSPVWRVGMAGHSAKDWSAQNCVLVGFLTRWSNDNQLLLATKVSRLYDSASAQ